MSARAPGAAEASAAATDRLVVARALPAPEDGLERVGWRLTVWRLALEPAVHPWSARWRLRRRAPVAAVLAALLLLLPFALGGCASTPKQSLRSSASAPRPADGPRCESILLSHEVQIPLEGELGDLRVTIDDLPPVTGKLRVLVRRPRFAASLELQADQPADFDKVLDVTPGPGQRSLTLVLSRPRRARDDWPRRECKACRVDVEITGLFGAREALDGWFRRATQEAAAIENGPPRPSPARRGAAASRSSLSCAPCRPPFPSSTRAGRSCTAASLACRTPPPPCAPGSPPLLPWKGLPRPRPGARDGRPRFEQAERCARAPPTSTPSRSSPRWPRRTRRSRPAGSPSRWRPTWPACRSGSSSCRGSATSTTRKRGWSG